VTLEDVLERIVGDVQDEFELEDEEVVHLDEGRARVSGLMSIEDANQRFGLAIDDPFYNTLGGYVFGQLGRRPEVGDEVESARHTLRVDVLDGLRIDRLLILPRTDEPAADPFDPQFDDVGEG
jgi:CBS domain containing-hemolysin-like protein